jgi:hypothetical protein
MNYVDLFFNSRRALLPCCMALVGCAGCVEPNYRNEVSTNSQGAVEVHRVEKDELATPPAHPAPDSPQSTPALTTTGSIDDRIAALQAQIDKLDAEITRLKLQKATGSPTP